MIWTNYIDVKQNTDEWHELRIGKITGSDAGIIMANNGKGFGEPAKKYARKLAIERETLMPATMSTTTKQMERGHEQEPDAVNLYEKQTLTKITNGGFFDFGTYGCSPDGLIGDHGVLEVKSQEGHVFLENLDKPIPSIYKWQIMMNMWVTGADWVDFVLYSAFMPIGKQLYIRRITRTKITNELGFLKERIGDFELLIKHYQNKILEFNGEGGF